MDGLKIENVQEIDNQTWLGHQFDTVMSMYYRQIGAGEREGDCKLEWWELTNIPYLRGMAEDVWKNIFRDYPQSPTFDPWRNRSKPCPGRDPNRIVITDPPSLAKRRGRNAKRYLCFRIIIRSTPGCRCRYSYLMVTAKQWIRMINGQNGGLAFRHPFDSGDCLWR